ncbi:MAG: PEP/pyruvate-binding domain-containing protein [Thermoplasmata archaeon]
MSAKIVLLEEMDPDSSSYGGKATGLAHLIRAGVNVPEGFVVPISAYDDFVASNDLEPKIRTILESTNFDNEASVKDCSNRIKALFSDAKMDFRFAEQLKETLDKKRPGCRWAVRSSAVAEDMPEASFAGQQDSFLCVSSSDVPEHVKKCWASYWNDRAIAYRHGSGIPQFLGGIAVLIQEMIDARASGILFTSDPISSNKNVSIIESSWGLGEAIVSGMVTPDRFECDKRSGTILRKNIGLKSRGIFMAPEGKVCRDIRPDMQRLSSITELEIEELVSLGRKIEKYFGKPQDVEWALGQDKIYILQARPITTIAKKTETLWTRAYGDEYWSDVTSPLFFSLLGHYLSEYVNREGSKIMGYKNLTNKELLRVHKGHIYFNSEVLEEVFTYNPRFSRTRELLNYFPKKDQERIANAKTRIIRRLLAEIRIALLDPDGMILRTAKAYDEWSVRFMQEMRRFDSLDLKKLSDNELFFEFKKMEKALLKHYRLIRYGLVTHSIGMNLIIKRWLSDWLNDKTGELYSKLISGLPGNKTIETNDAIVRLANMARADPSISTLLLNLDAGSFIERIDHEPQLAAFKKEFARFIEEYGHRSHTREIYFPRWADDPTLVVDMLKALVASPPVDLEKLEKEKINERLATEKFVLDSIGKMKFGFIKKILFKTIMGYAQTYLMFRENQRFYLDHQIARQRKLFMEYGRRFAERGWISQQEDIFFLSKEEIFEIAKTRVPLDIEIVKGRREDFKKFANVLPPKFLIGDTEFDDTVVSLEDVVRIDGTPSSPGIVTGKARVIDSIDHISEIQEDEILITSNTDPGWTAVFSKIGGLITETGGILSHGAVVSREYGIPAVTAVSRATEIIKTGQTITVDGNDGVIYIRGAKGGSDVIHEFGKDLNWNESFYFNFYDRKEDICGFMRIGLRPNRKHKSVFCYLLAPGDLVLGKRGKIRFLGEELEGLGLRFEKKIPEKVWRLVFSGVMDGPHPEKVEFDLLFDACNEIFDYRSCASEDEKEIYGTVVSEHLEQFGRVKGRLEIGNRKYIIDGLGERDHSWGVRDWHAPKMWIWLTCQFSDKAAFNIAKLVGDKGVVDAGFIHLNGRNIPIVDVNIDTKYADDGSPRSLSIQLIDKEGGNHPIHAEVMRGTALPFEGKEEKKLSIMHETLAKYRYKDMTGYGIAEYLIRKI